MLILALYPNLLNVSIEIKNMSEEQLQNKIGISLYKDVIGELKKKVQKQGQKLNLSMRSKKEFFNITMNDNYDLEIKTLCFKHGKSMLDFEFCEESDGTRRIFDFLDILLNKNQNSVYVIDEMERSLHPNLFNHFIELLNEYQKQSNIQVIFTTHESSIMKQDLFRKDTFNKLGYKTKINTHTTSCINLFLDIYLYSEYRLIYC